MSKEIDNSLAITCICALAVGMLTFFTIILNSMLLIYIEAGILMTCVSFGIADILRSQRRGAKQ